MSFAAAFLLAAAAAHSAPAIEPPPPDHGAQFDSARISVTILRPALVNGGELVSNGSGANPHSQRQAGAGYVTYLFE